MVIWELTNFEDGCLQKAIGEELKSSLKELSHSAQMKGRPIHKTAGKAKERKRETLKTTRWNPPEAGRPFLAVFVSFLVL